MENVASQAQLHQRKTQNAKNPKPKRVVRGKLSIPVLNVGRPSLCKRVLNTTAHKEQVRFLHAFDFLQEQGGEGTAVLTISRDRSMILWRHLEDREGSCLVPVRCLPIAHVHAPSSFTVGESTDVVFTGGRRQIIEWHLAEEGDAVVHRRMRLPESSAGGDAVDGSLPTITALVCFDKQTGLREGWLAAGLDQGDVYIFANDAQVPFIHIQQQICMTNSLVVPDSLIVSPHGSYLYGATEDVAFSITMPKELDLDRVASDAGGTATKDHGANRWKVGSSFATTSQAALESMHDMLPHATGESITTMKSMVHEVDGATMQLLAAGSVTGRVFVWRPGHKLLYESDNQASAATCVDILDQGEYGHVITGFIDGQVTCVDVKSKRRTDSIQLDNPVQELFIRKQGSGSVIFGVTTRNAFVWLPALVGGPPLVDVAALASLYRAESSCPGTGHRWLNPESETKRCIVFSGLRGSISTVQVTDSAIMCGTSYGGVGSWIKHPDHHDAQLNDSHADYRKGKTLGERRVALPPKDRDRKDQDIQLLKVDAAELFKSSEGKSQARWWSLEMQRVLQHETATSNALFWKQLRDAVVLLNDTLQMMSFAWTLGPGPSIFPSLSPRYLATLLAFDVDFEWQFYLFTVDSFSMACVVSSLLAIAVLSHHAFASLWVLQAKLDGQLQPCCLKKTDSELCRTTPKKLIWLLLKLLLGMCWLGSTVGFMPLMRQLMKPTSNCCGGLIGSFAPSNDRIACTNQTLPQCFASEHVTRYFTALTLTPLLWWYTARLRRLNGKAIYMSTAFLRWDRDIYELASQDESIFSQHRSNLIQRVFVTLLVLFLYANYVLNQEETLPQLMLTLLVISLAVWLLFFTLQPYYDARMNAFRTSLNTACILNNCIATLYVFNPSWNTSNTPMIIFYCALLPFMVAVYRLHLFCLPKDKADEQPLSFERDAKFCVAKVRSNNFEARRVGMKDLTIIASHAASVTSIMNYESFFKRRLKHSDPQVVFMAIRCVRLLCRSKNVINAKYVADPKSIIVPSANCLGKHFSELKDPLVLEILRWVDAVENDSREEFIDYLEKQEQSSESEHTRFQNFLGTAERFKDCVLEQLFAALLSHTKTCNVSRFRGIALLMCRVIAWLAHDLKLLRHVKECTGEAHWEWAPNERRIKAMVKINSEISEEETSLRSKVDEWKQIYLGSGNHEVKTKMDTLITDTAARLL